MLHQVSPETIAAKADPDFPGLSFAYRFRDGQAEPLAGRDIPAALKEPGGWIWIHLSLVDIYARNWITKTAPLPDRARDILLSDDEHQLLEPIDGGVAGVFADLLRETAAGETRELGRLHFALTDTLVVSGRRAALGAIQRTLDALGKGKKFPDAITLLEEIVSHFADAVALVAQELSDTLDAIEESLIEEGSAGEGRKLGPARRTAVRLHRQLSTLRLLFRRWSVPDEGAPTRIGLTSGRLAQRLDGLDHEIVAIQERARLLQDEIAAKVAAETNRHLFVLTILTAFLLPPTLVSGIFGMNVSDLPFTKDAGGFTWAMGLILISVVLVYVMMRLLRITR